MSPKPKSAPVWREKGGEFPAYIPSWYCRVSRWTLRVSEHQRGFSLQGAGIWSFYATRGDAVFNSAWSEVNRLFRSKEGAQRAALEWVRSGAPGADDHTPGKTPSESA